MLLSSARKKQLHFEKPKQIKRNVLHFVWDIFFKLKSTRNLYLIVQTS